MKIMLLGHQKNVGKDTIADILSDHADQVFGPTRGCKIGFADAVKDTAFRMYKPYGLKPGYFYDIPENVHLKELPLPILFNGRPKSPRDLYIEIGTFGRSLDKYVWANMTADLSHQAQRAGKLVLIKDFRYPDETKPFESMGLRYLKVKVHSQRCGVGDEPDNALLDYPHWHYHFYNDGPKEELRERVLKELWPLVEAECYE